MTASPWSRCVRDIHPLLTGTLVLCLFSLPASAYHTVFINDCEEKRIGAACNDRYSGSKPGTCIEGQCMDSANFLAMGSSEEGPDEEKVEPVYFDCHTCRNPEQLESLRSHALQRKWMLWGGLTTTGGIISALIGFLWRRTRVVNKAIRP